MFDPRCMLVCEVKGLNTKGRLRTWTNDERPAPVCGIPIPVRSPVEYARAMLAILVRVSAQDSTRSTFVLLFTIEKFPFTALQGLFFFFQFQLFISYFSQIKRRVYPILSYHKNSFRQG